MKQRWKRTLRRQTQEKTRSRWTRRTVGKANRNLKWTREPAAEGVEGTKVSGKTFNFTTVDAVGFPQMQYVRTFEFWSFFCNHIFSYLMKLCFRFLTRCGICCPLVVLLREIHIFCFSLMNLRIMEMIKVLPRLSWLHFWSL